MDVTSVECPECKQKIFNPVAVDEKLRCGGCGHVFALQSNASGLDGNVPVPLEKQLPVLGKEPAAGTYGLLYILAWTLLVFCIIASFQTAHSTPVALGARRQSSDLSIFLTFLKYVFYAIGGICLVGCFQKMDAAATWLSWRSAALAQAVSNPPGSSLTYILPWTVSGGLLVIVAIAKAANPSAVTATQPTLWGSMNSGGLGVLLFLMGLGCGELRRFFWRMAQLAKPLPRRQRGTEAGIGEPTKVYSLIFNSNAALFVLVALPVLVFGVGAFAWTFFESGFFRLSGLSSEITLYLAIALLSIGGGTYTMYHLSTLWGDMLHDWEYAAATIEHKKLVRTGWKASQAFVIVAWALGVLMILAQVILFLTATSELPAYAKLLSLCSTCLAVLFVGWLATLKSDSLRLRNASSDIGHKHNVAPGRFARIAARILILIAVANFVWTLIESYRVINAVGSLAVRGGPAASMMMASASLVMLMGLATNCLPPFWCALVLLDFNHAAGNLAAVQERAAAVKPS